MFNLIIFQIMPQHIRSCRMCKIRHHGQFAKIWMLNHGIFIDQELGSKPESRAFFGWSTFLIVFKTNLAMHQADQLFGNCQTKTGTAKLTGHRGITLREGLKQLFTVGTTQANAAILYTKMQHTLIHSIMFHACPDNDFSIRSEFDRIGNQVGQNLFKS